MTSAEFVREWRGRRGVALTWPKSERVSDWVDANVILPPDSAEAGTPYSTKRTAYVAEWQDSAGLGWVRQTTVVASTQVGKTQSSLNILAYAVCKDPGPITWVVPTREDAAEFCENKVMEAVDITPAWRRMLTEERFDAKRRQIRFKSCRMLFRASQKPKELASYPARWLFGDECDKWALRSKGEAPPFNLALERTRTFWNHKVYMSSTPVSEDGLIWTEFQKGDRRRYHVPCPHCGVYQVLRFGQVKWPEDIETGEQMKRRREAWYECEACAGRIEDRHKEAMIAAGVWCPEDLDLEEHLQDGQLVWDDRNAHRSYHIWAGYSPWVTWYQVAYEFLQTHGTPSFQNFVNSWLGEPWVNRVEETRQDELQSCIGGYTRGTVPEGVKVITAGVDVQKRFLVYTIRGWGLDMESWLLDHGRIDDFDQLAAVLFMKTWPDLLMPVQALVDANYRTGEVIDFAKRYPAQVRMCRGQEFDQPIPFKAQAVERHPRTGHPIGNLKAWHVNVGMFKDLLAQSIRVGGVAETGGFHVYEEVDRTYRDEMTSEHKVLEQKAGRERMRWVKKTAGRQNHYWDTEVYNRALAQLLRVDTLRSEGEAAAARAPRRRQRREPQQHRGIGWRRT